MERHDEQLHHGDDLQEFWLSVREFWARWGNAVMITVTVIAIAFAAYQILTTRSRAAHEDAWADLALETSPQGFRAVAETHSDPTVQTLAYLHGGDLLLAEALAPQDEPTTPEPAEGEPAIPTPKPLSPEESLKQAHEMYENALRVARHPAYRLNALMGLASVAESQGNWDDARGRYETVIKDGGELFPSIVALAKARLDALDGLKQPVRFAPEAPASAPTPEAAAPEAPAATPAPEAAPAEAPAPTAESTAPAEPAQQP